MLQVLIHRYCHRLSRLFLVALFLLSGSTVSAWEPEWSNVYTLVMEPKMGEYISEWGKRADQSPTSAEVLALLVAARPQAPKSFAPDLTLLRKSLKLADNSSDLGAQVVTRWILASALKEEIEEPTKLAHEAQVLLVKMNAPIELLYVAMNYEAVMFYIAGRPKDALSCYQQWLKQHGKNAPPSMRFSVESSMVNCYRALGYYHLALPLQEKLLQHVKETGETKRYCYALLTLAEIQIGLGFYGEAVPTLQMVVEQSWKLDQNDGIWVRSSAHNHLISAWIRLGDYRPALPLIEEIVAEADQKLGASLEDYRPSDGVRDYAIMVAAQNLIAAHLKLGIVYHGLGQTELALESYDTALAYLQSVKDVSSPLFPAWEFQVWADIFLNHGYYDLAGELTAMMLELYRDARQTLGTNADLALWATLGAKVAEKKGELEEALSLSYIARKAYQNRGKADAVVATDLNSVEWLRRLGRVEEAEQLLLDVERGLQLSALHEETAMSFLLMAFQYRSWGRYSEAQLTMKKVIAFAEERELEFLEALARGSLGNLYARLGVNDNAVAELTKALEYYEERGSAEQAAYLQLSLAVIAFSEGRTESAMRYLENERAWREKTSAIGGYDELIRRGLSQRKPTEQSWEIIETLLKQALAEGDRLRIAEYNELFAKMLVHDSRPKEAVAKFLAAYQQFRALQRDSKQLEVAKSVLTFLRDNGPTEEATTIATEGLALLKIREDEAFFTGGVHAAYSLGHNYKSIRDNAALLAIDDERSESAFDIIEDARARYLSLTRLAALASGKHPDAKKTMQKVRELHSRATVLEGWLSAQQDHKAGEISLSEIREHRDQALKLEASLVNGMVGSTSRANTSLDALRRRLPKGTLMLAYAVLEQELYLFAVRQEKLSAVSLGPFDPKAYQLQLRKLSDSSASSISASEAGQLLYRQLLAPVEELFSGIETLLIIPDDTLHHLPFEALKDKKGHYLVETFEVSYLNTAREFEDLPFEFPPKSAVVFAGVDYGHEGKAVPGKPKQFESTRGGAVRNGGRDWQPLKATLREAEDVSKALSVKPVLGKDATESRFKKLAPGADWIHIATHGYVAEQLGSLAGLEDLGKGYLEVERALQGYRTIAMDPLKNAGLIFAGANKGGDGVDDGDLTAYEVASLDLSRAQLVILSACRTGLGELKGAEGVFGLKRAFIVAGAQRLLLSLWDVDDQATAMLMKQFYHALAEGQKPVSALRSAKLKMLQTPEFASPASWAGFVLIGPH